MLVQTRGIYPCNMAVVRLPFHRVARESFLVVVSGEHILKDINLDCFPSQVPFTIEQEVPEGLFRRKRWDEGVYNIQQIWREIKAQGYPILTGRSDAIWKPYVGKSLPSCCESNQGTPALCKRSGARQSGCPGRINPRSQQWASGRPGDEN